MKQVRRYHIYLALLLLIVLFLWAAFNIRQNREYQQSAAKTASFKAERLIERELEDQHRLIGVYILNHKSRLTQLLRSPHDQGLYTRFLASAQEVFPGLVAVSLADSSGHILQDDFSGLVGASCRADLASFSYTRLKQYKLHRDPVSFHYDMIVPWHDNNAEYLFLASFRLDRILTVLNTQSNEYRKLYFRLNSASETGVHLLGFRKSNSDTPDIRELDLDDQSEVLEQLALQDTDWSIVAVLNQKAEREMREFYIIRALLTFAVVVLAGYMIIRHR